MPGKMSDPGTIPEKIMKSEGDAGENEEIWANSRERSGQAPEKVESKQVSGRWNLGQDRRRGIRASSEK